MMLHPLIMSLADYIWVPLLLFFNILTRTNVNLVFAGLFVFRYTRLIANTIAYYGIYRPTRIPANPTILPQDCTVIIPTVDPENAGFQECIHTVLKNKPGTVLIVTVGNEKLKLVKQVVGPLRNSWPATTISVTATEIANKRLQVCHAIPQIKTTITVLVDDHVYWPSANFLKTICAPFENPKVGGLGTNKVVRRTGWGYSLKSIFNFWGCIYLERHNFELAATNAIDGSVFVLSGRTSAHRTAILQDQEFLRGFSNEKFFFGKFGPIAADDDNFITRWEVKKRWDIKFQHCPDATIETDVGEPHKYLQQCMRWVRTTWRSNSCSLFTDRTVWRSQPWGVYAIHISSFFNFALFYDSSLIYTLGKTTFGQSENALYYMIAWIFASKMIKLMPHFRRNPADILLIPAYLLFAYYHSVMKLWALFTFWDCTWSGRNLAAVNTDAPDSDDADAGTDRHSNDSGYRSHGSDQDAPSSNGSDDNPPIPTSPRPSIASSTGSASYGISQWTAWEKASNNSTSMLRSPGPSPLSKQSLGPPTKSTASSTSVHRNDYPATVPTSIDDWLQREIPFSGSSPSSHSNSSASAVRTNSQPAQSSTSINDWLERSTRSSAPSPDEHNSHTSSPRSLTSYGRPRSASPPIQRPPTAILLQSIDTSDTSADEEFCPCSRRSSSSGSSTSSEPASSARSASTSSSSSNTITTTTSSSSSRPRPSSYWADFPQHNAEAPCPGPFMLTSFSSSSAGVHSSSVESASSGAHTPPLLVSARSVRVAGLFGGPIAIVNPKPAAAAASLSMPSPSPSPLPLPLGEEEDDTRRQTRTSKRRAPSTAAPRQQQTAAKKRTRGSDCGRQHEVGHRIGEEGVCELPGWVGDVGLDYGGRGGKRVRRVGRGWEGG